MKSNIEIITFLLKLKKKSLPPKTVVKIKGQ